MPETTKAKRAMPAAHGPLKGLRVIDCATLFAGPIISTLMGDFGADVIKVEHPSGDPLRNMGAKKQGHGLWWKTTGRNKRCIALDLKLAADAERQDPGERVVVIEHDDEPRQVLVHRPQPIIDPRSQRRMPTEQPA